MAFVSYQELPSRSGSYRLESGGLTHEYKREYLVTTGAADGFITAISGLPYGLRSAYAIVVAGPVTIEHDDFVYCSSVDGSVVNQITNGGVDYLQWKITLDFTPIDLNYNHLVPTDNTPKVSWQFVQYQEPAEIDINTNNPILNSASCPFDPAPVRDQSRPTLVIERNESSFSAATASAYVDTVNTGVFHGLAAKTLKCNSISADIQSTPGGVYWVVRYEFAYDKNTWKLKLLDAGYQKLVSGQLVEIKSTTDGSVPATPVPLDGSGLPLTRPVDHTNVVFLEFDIYPDVDFATAFSFGSIPGL